MFYLSKNYSKIYLQSKMDKIQKNNKKYNKLIQTKNKKINKKISKNFVEVYKLERENTKRKKTINEF